MEDRRDRFLEMDLKALRALRRAARSVVEEAQRKGEKIPILKDGQVVYASPEELLRKMDEEEKNLPKPFQITG